MNEDHLRRLRYATKTWNAWRREQPEIRPDLTNAVLNSLASRSTHSSHKSVFSRFEQRSFEGVNLRNADLRGAKIWISDLSHADLRGADMRKAEIRRSQLTSADLRGADLRSTQFLAANLSGARVDDAIFGDTHLGFTPLVDVNGLNHVEHRKMSHIDQFSIIRSVPLPISFLHACGVQAHTIRTAELYAQSRPHSTCFISYSRRDEPFVGYLREWLTWNAVPSWFAPQDMRREEFQSSDVELERDLYTYVDEAERALLVISPNILPSGWVGKEFQRALRRTPVIPILIENMPHPDSLEWRSLIAKTVEEVDYTQLNPDEYSNELKQLLIGQFLDFRNWREPSILAQRLPALLPLLMRTI